MESELRIIPISRAPWGDVAQVFGARGDPAGCWCQYFKITNAEWNGGNRKEFESMLREQSSHDGPGPGLIAYVDGEPAGWCAVEPRPRTPRLFNSKISMAGRRETEEDESVWAITCFVVRIGHRRRGLSKALVSAAVELAKNSGAKMNSADLYHGTVAVFEAAGFEVVARPTDRRACVRLEL